MNISDATRAGIEAYVDAYRTDEPRRLMLWPRRRERPETGGSGGR